jgi:hypothetical protein
MQGTILRFVMMTPADGHHPSYHVEAYWLETTVRKCGGGRPRSAAPRSRLVPPWGGCQLLLLAFGGPA